MSTVTSAQYDALFGPPSLPINVSQFVSNAFRYQSGTEDLLFDPWSTTSGCLPQSIRDEWLELPEAERNAIEDECGVEDVRVALDNVISNPRLMHHITKAHETRVCNIYEAAAASNRRKRKRKTASESQGEHPEVASFREKLGGIALKSWPLTMNAALFIRPPKQSDHNTLIETKQLSTFQGQGVNVIHQALIFVTIYNPISWGHRLLARSSQHVLLSSQTLGDLFRAIPCTSHELSREIVHEDGTVLSGNKTPSDFKGAVFCIEGLLYGDSHPGEDYAEKYIHYVSLLSEKKRPKVEKSTSMHDTAFLNMTIRLQSPNWLLHAGNCVHHIVFEHIRLLHPQDPPPSAFPLTTQITPPLLDSCRACNKVPAVLSITGDVRLGESPFVICQPCWECMGMPKGEEAHRVTVTPLPKYEFGWKMETTG